MPGPLSTRVPRWIAIPAGMATIVLVAAIVIALRPERTPAGEPDGPAGPPRKPMTVHLFVDPERVVHRTRFLFTFDTPEALADLRREERLDEVVAGAGSDLERFRLLTAWARSLFEPGLPDPYPPLDARVILRDIRSGFTGGFCAQYNYVLAQSLMALGYPARYVSVVDHEVIEAWLRDEKRWVCLDPLHAATYVDGQGRPLSVLEIVRAVRRGRPPSPGPGSLPGADGQIVRSFSRFAVWIRNDHIARPLNFTDIGRYKVAFLQEGETPPPDGLATSRPDDLYFDPDSP